MRADPSSQRQTTGVAKQARAAKQAAPAEQRRRAKRPVSAVAAATFAVVAAALGAVGLALSPMAWAGPRPASSRAPASASPATAVPAPATTLAPLGTHLAPPPSTLPLTDKPPSAHVSGVLAVLSGAGFAVALLIMAVQYVLTRPRGRGHGF